MGLYRSIVHPSLLPLSPSFSSLSLSLLSTLSFSLSLSLRNSNFRNLKTSKIAPTCPSKTKKTTKKKNAPSPLKMKIKEI
ncbi:hypothetical protein OAV88_01775 [bacterium]|nr:hypothetical protein [bacterium]